MITFLSSIIKSRKIHKIHNNNPKEALPALKRLNWIPKKDFRKAFLSHLPWFISNKILFTGQKVSAQGSTHRLEERPALVHGSLCQPMRMGDRSSDLLIDLNLPCIICIWSYQRFKLINYFWFILYSDFDKFIFTRFDCIKTFFYLINLNILIQFDC